MKNENMENEAKALNNEDSQKLRKNVDQTPISTTNNSEFVQQFGYALNNINKLPILKLIVGVTGALFLLFILGKLINKYDVTSVCIAWSCLIKQNLDNCSTKHLVSLGVGGTFGLLLGFGTPFFLPAGAIIAPAIAGLLVGAGIFGASTALLEFLIPC